MRARSLIPSMQILMERVLRAFVHPVQFGLLFVVDIKVVLQQYGFLPVLINRNHDADYQNQSKNDVKCFHAHNLRLSDNFAREGNHALL